MSDFITTCKLFSREYFGEDILSKEDTQVESFDIDARIMAVESVKRDLNKGGIHEHDTYLTKMVSIYESLKPTLGEELNSLHLDIDQNFVKFIQGVDERH